MGKTRSSHDAVEREYVTQAKAAKRLTITQPRISEITRG